MPIGNGTPAGSVPLDAINAVQVAGLLAEAACADAAPDRDGLDDLHVALAVAAADLDDAIAEHADVLRP